MTHTFKILVVAFVAILVALLVFALVTPGNTDSTQRSDTVAPNTNTGAGQASASNYSNGAWRYSANQRMVVASSTPAFQNAAGTPVASQPSKSLMARLGRPQ